MKPFIRMRRFLRLSALLTLGAALTTPAGAALESIKFHPDNPQPQFPLSLKLDGITRGHAIVAIAVSDEGRLTDVLVVGYTHESFARSCVAALEEWQFTAARYNGTPVPAKVELTFNFTLEGAVISANIVNHFFFDNFERMGDGRYVYRPCKASEIDRVPVPVFAVAPKYAAEAEKQLSLIHI